MISVEELERLHRIGAEMSSLKKFNDTVLSDVVAVEVSEGNADIIRDVLLELPESLKKSLILDLHKTIIEFACEQNKKYDQDYVIKNIFHPFRD